MQVLLLFLVSIVPLSPLSFLIPLDRIFLSMIFQLHIS